MALEEAGWIKVTSDNNLFDNAIQGNKRENFKIEKENLLERGTDGDWRAVDMYYCQVGYEVKIGGSDILGVAVNWSDYS